MFVGYAGQNHEENKGTEKKGYPKIEIMKMIKVRNGQGHGRFRNRRKQIGQQPHRQLWPMGQRGKG